MFESGKSWKVLTRQLGVLDCQRFSDSLLGQPVHERKAIEKEVTSVFLPISTTNPNIGGSLLPSGERQQQKQNSHSSQAEFLVYRKKVGNKTSNQLDHLTRYVEAGRDWLMKVDLRDAYMCIQTTTASVGEVNYQFPASSLI